MKIRDGFILREVADSFIVVAVGEAVKTFNGIVNLNETGAFLWKILEQGATKEELLKRLTAEYDVDDATAKKDIDAFVEKLEEAKLVK